MPIACRGCGIDKPEQAFPFRNKDKGIRHKLCKECYRQTVCRTHYRENKEQYLARNAKVKLAMQAYVLDQKNRPCMDCGNQFHFTAMEFDHVRGEKLFNIADVRKRSSLGRLKREIAKCDIVCSNCHRYRTWLRLQP